MKMMRKMKLSLISTYNKKVVKKVKKKTNTLIQEIIGYIVLSSRL